MHIENNYVLSIVYASYAFGTNSKQELIAYAIEPTS